ncbi:MAG TPA: MmgE/PrpD family protein [Vicinamibacterales bacterium]|nr:MmgE/PrpD family protein [Vicinamibacterales bacterium]
MNEAASTGTIARLAAFAASAGVPPEARRRAAAAILDTVGVTIAGASQPASRIVRGSVAGEGSGPCTVLGTSVCTSARGAALANGTAAHALDYDDMCFVSLAHPSAPLVAALLSAGELAGASGAALVDGYVVGFEIEARLGSLMNPRHYQRGWHCTSTLGTIGAAAGASRVLGLDAARIAHALAIAASAAAGLKENFGTMVKPLHAGLAAERGVLAAQLAAGGLTASDAAIDGPQGFLRAMDSEHADPGPALADLGSRWEIIDTGITVKLYPSCAGTHPTLDALLELLASEALSADMIDRIEVGVDAITPTVLIHDRPASGLEAKFSMPFCVAAAMVDGRVGIHTFDETRIQDPRIRSLMPRVVMNVDPSLDPRAPPLTEARVRIVLRDGRTVERAAHGARGYPERPASEAELEAKFRACAARALPAGATSRALDLLGGLETVIDVRTVTAELRGPDA